MTTKETFLEILRKLDGKGYKEYKKVVGSYNYGHFTLFIDHVQGDPYASPSLCRIQISHNIAQFPTELYHTRSREIALRDYITRSLSQTIKKITKGSRGSGNSGKIIIDAPGQEVLEKTSVLFFKDIIEIRFAVGLPGDGRRISSREATTIFFKHIDHLIDTCLLYSNTNHQNITNHVECCEDADYMRNMLEQENLVAFIANESILPRESGNSQLPSQSKNIIPFFAPDSMTVTIQRPNGGPISGLGIKKGITLITGGCFHGKTTLLNAIQYGIYNHIPGDGREFVVSTPSAFKVRAEDGRSITGTDISPFITNLPFGKNTSSFSTINASGSTSQAANIIEAIEAGSKCLLIDEDTSATNFMIRDWRMQLLIDKSNEPITPYIDRIENLAHEKGISTILVIGGCGDYLDVADQVIMMSAYKASDSTAIAQRIARENPLTRPKELISDMGEITSRYPIINRQDTGKGERENQIKATAKSTIQIGRSEIKLEALEQVVHNSQTKAITHALLYLLPYLNGKHSMCELLNMLQNKIEHTGLESLSEKPDGSMAAFRLIELAATINHCSILKTR